MRVNPKVINRIGGSSMQRETTGVESHLFRDDREERREVLSRRHPARTNQTAIIGLINTEVCVADHCTDKASQVSTEQNRRRHKSTCIFQELFGDSMVCN